MATRKQKEKNKEKLADEVSTREMPLRQSPRKRAGSSAASPAKPIMNSLDMLAQVAAKLQEPGSSGDGGQTAPKKKDADPGPRKASPKDKAKSVEKKPTAEESNEAEENAEEKPKPKPGKTPPKKVTKRSIQSLEEVTLDQIKALSNKAIISLFAEMTANEMTRNYTYTCYLMPDKCQETVSSFGNETKARNSMISHLNTHISLLVQKAEDGSEKEEFVAIPITVRRKKEAEAAKKRKRSLLTGTDPSKRRRTSKPKFTAIKASKSDEDMEREMSDDEQADTTVEQPASPVGSDSGKSKEKPTPDADKPRKKTRHTSDRQSASHSSQADEGGSGTQQNGHAASSDEKPAAKKANRSSHSSTQGQSSQQSEDEEQTIIDTMSRMQPFLDHSYTTVFGKRSNADDSWMSHSSGGEDDDEDFDEEDGELSDSSSCPSTKSGSGDRNKKTVPILPLSQYAGGDVEVPMASSEEIIPRRGRPGASGAADSERPGHSGEKPYPPMPKSALASRGRLVVPEEEGSASETEESAAATPKKRKKMTKGSKESHAEWEKRIALKCIRELRGRKKDDKVTLVCKICKDKSFTAGATLMYHYRSHAGIKPFVCVICNTTFTRQHSLNYHMLIHNNQSRFSCKDCGRKFRHPSHFKEHLRRHTGETPFECTECQSRFKTRNTYKRHLKTRHGKLLTVFGIHPMSKEEFLKVRTKPYKKSPGEVAHTSQPQARSSVQPHPNSLLHTPHSRPRKIRTEESSSAVTNASSAQVVDPMPQAPAPTPITIPSAAITSPAGHNIVTAQPPFITFSTNAPAQQAAGAAPHSIAVATSINAPNISMTSPAATYYIPPITFTTGSSGIVSMQVSAPQTDDAMEAVNGSGDDSDAVYVPIGIVEH